MGRAASWGNQDGGKDMYGFPPYGGNRISTSLCKQTGCTFGDGFDCIDRTVWTCGSYRMDMRDSMLVLVTKNDANAEYIYAAFDCRLHRFILTSDLAFCSVVAVDLLYTGSTGADGHGVKTTRQFRSGTLQGFGSTLCGSGDPAIHHMLIIDAMLSPHARHIHDGALDSDDDGALKRMFVNTHYVCHDFYLRV